MKTLNINEIANLVGKTIKWQAPAAEGNETYGGIARIIGVNKEERFPITVETISGDDFSAADEMCQSINNFKSKDKFVHFILRCLEQEEFDVVQDFLKTNPHGDVSEVYSPFLSAITI